MKLFRKVCEFWGHQYTFSAPQLDYQTVYGTIKRLGDIIMNIIDDIKPVTYLKSRAADLLKQINETHRPVIITQNGEPKAVLQDPESYENMRNAIGILKLLSQGEEDIKAGGGKSQEAVFADLEAKLKIK
jgi:prevent-host-death family protein